MVGVHIVFSPTNGRTYCNKIGRSSLAFAAVLVVAGALHMVETGYTEEANTFEANGTLEGYMQQEANTQELFVFLGLDLEWFLLVLSESDAVCSDQVEASNSD